MGLDMYLDRCDRRAWGYKGMDISEIKTNKPDLYNDLKPYIHVRGSEYYRWESLFEEVGYWRKANAIHNWFVKNVQNDVDDCEYYEVSKEQLEQLLDVCNEVLEYCDLVEGKITNGYTFDESGRKIPILEDGKYIENTSVAEELLPTTGGFFFGSTDYDEYYIEDIESTVEIITKVLETTDFDREMITYCSSW